MRSVRLLLAVAFMFAGCAASGPLYKDVAASIPPIPSDKGRIFFYRPDSIVGGAVTSDIKLNGRVVGRSERGGFFYVDEAPGNFTVLTSTEVEKSLTFTLGRGERKFVRTIVSMGALVGRIQAELVNASEAKAEINELAYIGTVPGLAKK